MKKQPLCKSEYLQFHDNPDKTCLLRKMVWDNQKLQNSHEINLVVRFFSELLFWRSTENFESQLSSEITLYRERDHNIRYTAHLILTLLTWNPDSPVSLHLSRSSTRPHLLLWSLSRHQSPPDSPPAGRFSSSVDARLVCSDKRIRRQKRYETTRGVFINAVTNS